MALALKPATEKRKGSESSVVCNLDDIQKLAKQKLPRDLYEYLASGTGQEQTLSENCTAFNHWYLRPRVMRPIPLNRIFTDATLFHSSSSMPIFASPAGVQSLCHPDGECATARACSKMGIMFGLSQHSTCSIEEVAKANNTGNRWFQAYILRDRETSLRLVQRAVKSGYQGIFLTVDSIRFGYREADARNGFDSLPAPHRFANYEPYFADSIENKDSDLNEVKPTKSQEASMDKTYNSRIHASWDQNTEAMMDTNASWEDVCWLKLELQRMAANLKKKRLPLVVKGIMTGEDAIAALEIGKADGVMVSNHGGRQLDGCLSTIDVLPEIVRAVNGRAPIWLDGGIRRGTDVLKALALGASAVGIGKPLFFALAAGGEEEVVNMLKILKKELKSAMALCGCKSLKDVTPALVTRHPFSFESNYVRSAL